jgi:hypothetical protein
LHFLLGGVGIILGYRATGLATFLGSLYLLLAFAEMYVLMPLKVCPNCVYYRLEGSLCISGLNVFSRRVAREGHPRDLVNRSQGLLCPNNLYLASLALPILAMIPALVLNFAFSLLAIFVVVVGLLVFRFFVIFPQIACLHCRAKYRCPQAEQMGVRDL